MVTTAPSATLLLLLLAASTSGDLEDTELARRIKNGDRDAFERFFRRHHAALFRYLRRRGLPGDVAEDVIQNAFVRIWKRRDEINPSKSLRAYLFRIGYTRALNHFRDTAKFDDTAVLDEHAAAAAPDADAAHQMLLDDLHDAVESLPERRRAVFELCFMEDLTYREAADALGIARKTVENHMGRALKDIRAALEPYRSGDTG